MAAPVEALQERVGVVLTPVAPLEGAESAGADGMVTGVVVNIVYNNRFGVPEGTFTILLGVAMLLSADCTDAGEVPGLACRYNAAAPATCGVAMEVPEIVLVAVEEVYQAEVIEEPGARISTTVPKLE